MAIVSAPNAAAAEELQVFKFPVYGYPPRVEETMPKVKFEIYFRMKLQTSFKNKLEWNPEKYLVAVTLSKKVIYERFDEYSRI